MKKRVTIPDRLITVTFLLIASTIAIWSNAGTQDLFLPMQELVSIDVEMSHSLYHAGSTVSVAVVTEIKDGWHINSNKPLDKFLIPTVLEIRAPVGLEIIDILYPQPDVEKLEISDGDMSLYHGRVVFGARLRVNENVESGSYKITAELTYQGCNNLTCIEPRSVVGEVSLRVGTIQEQTEVQNFELFSKPPFVDPQGHPVGTGAVQETEGKVGGLIESRGLFVAFVFIFIGGLALNLTPCIYPIIPITVSYFGGQAGGKASRTFFLSLFYVLGISITYSVLGTIAALTGSLFGSALENPFVIGFIALVLVGLATSMFGLWEITMPTFLMRRTGQAKQGYLGAIFMGLTVGIVAAPCIGPFVLGLLTYVGKHGNPALGFFMFFTLAWGMGIPFIVLGTVSGSISKLPRSGDWMIWVRKIFGFILIAMAVYFSRYLIGDRLTFSAYAVIALVAGIFLGWLDRTPATSRSFIFVRRIVGLAGIAVAAFFFVIPGGPFREEIKEPGIDWIDYSKDNLAQALDAGHPVMIDFTAEWCIPCHELDNEVFSDPAVIELSNKIVPLRVDLTREDDREKMIKKNFAIKGVPTIIFIDRSGAESRELRVTGFVEKEEIVKRLKRIVQSG